MNRTIWIGLASVALGCGGGTTEPNVLGPADLARVTASLQVLAGDAQTDTIQGTLKTPVTVQLATVEATPQPIVGVIVNFVVVEPNCGRPFAGSALTDASGKAAERWELGTRVGKCTMEARVVDADGTPKVLAKVTATITAGRPAVFRMVADFDSVVVSGWHVFGLSGLRDRNENRVDWTVSSITGPFLVHVYPVPGNLPTDSYLIPTGTPAAGSITGTTTNGFSVSVAAWSCAAPNGRKTVYAASQLGACS